MLSNLVRAGIAAALVTSGVVRVTAQETSDAGRLAELAENGLVSPTEFGIALLDQAKVQHAQGNLGEAEALSRKALDQFRKVSGDGISMQVRDVNEVVALTLIGDIQSRRGDFAAARQTYLEQLAIARRQVSVQPTSFQWRSLQRISHHQLGDMQLALHEPVLAWQSYSSALDISRALLAVNPDCWALSYEDAVALIKVGEAQTALGAKVSAERSFASATDMLRTLVAARPEAADIHRDLLIVLVQRGDLNANRAFYAQALDVAKVMRTRGLLATADAWMIADLEVKSGGRAVAAASSDPDYCGPVKEAIEHSRSRFAQIRGRVLDPTDPTFFASSLAPRWSSDCSISDYGVASWTCEVRLPRGVSAKALFARIDSPIQACLGANWSPYRTGNGEFPAVVYSSADAIVQVTALPRSVSIAVSTHPPS